MCSWGTRVRLLGRVIDRGAAAPLPGTGLCTAASMVLRLPVYDTHAEQNCSGARPHWPMHSNARSCPAGPSMWSCSVVCSSAHLAWPPSPWSECARSRCGAGWTARVRSWELSRCCVRFSTWAVSRSMGPGAGDAQVSAARQNSTREKSSGTRAQSASREAKGRVGEGGTRLALLAGGRGPPLRQWASAASPSVPMPVRTRVSAPTTGLTSGRRH